MAPRKRTTVTEEIEDSTESPPSMNQQFEELDESQVKIDMSYIHKINEFMARSQVELTPVFYLYKYDSIINGEQKALIHKYSGDPPDEDEVGKEFGSGRYLLCLSLPACAEFPKGAVRGYRFKLHQVYDTMKQQMSVFPVQAPVHKETGFNDMFGMMERFIAMVLPLLHRERDPDMSALMYRNFNTTNEILKRQMASNVQLLNDYQRKMSGLDDGNEEEMGNTQEQEQVSLLEQIIPLISEWLPKLIGTNAESKAVQSVVKNTPQFKQVVNDQRQFKKLIEYLDKTEGTEKTNQLLRNLRLNRVK